MKIALVLLSSILLCSQVSLAQNCRILVCLDGTLDSLSFSECSNPDSTLIDTCTMSSTYGQLFGKKFHLTLPFSYLSVTNPITNFAMWDSLLPVLATARATFGQFHILPRYPSVTDSGLLATRQVKFVLQDYAAVAGVVGLLEAASLQPQFVSKPANKLSVPNDKGMFPSTRGYDLQVANQESFWDYSRRLGHHWNLYSLKAPMAWEITKGHPSQVICAHDWWTCPDLLDTCRCCESGVIG